MKAVTVRIKKWEEYKGRKDVSNASWFRLSNRLLEDPDFFDFTHEELFVWIYILSIASQKSTDTVIVNFAHAERVARLSKKAVLSAIQKLEQNQLVPADVTETSRGRNADVTDTSATEHNKTEQYKTGSCPDIGPAESRPDPKALHKPETAEELKSLIPATVLDAWNKLYEPEFVEREIVKAVVWLNANPRKARKSVNGFKTFLASWFDRGWSRYSPPPQKSNTANPRNNGGGISALADKLVLATKKFPPGDEQIADFVGPDWHWVSRSGLMNMIRAMKADDPWAKKRLVDDLTAAFERHNATNNTAKGA